MKYFKLLLTSICVIALLPTSIAQPANDNPCGAISLTVENTGCEPTTTFSWVGATANNSYGSTYCNGPDKQDVWYKFTVPANGECKAAIDFATTYNMCAEFYTSTSCNVGGLTVFNQNTQGFPCMYTNSNSGGDGNFKNLVPGSTVYIRVFPLYYNNIPNADIKLCISSTNTLADEPCNAGFIPVDAADPLGQGCTPSKVFSWTGATLSAGVPNPDCIGSMNPSNIRDVWYKVRVPASGKVVINSATNNANTYATQVFTAASCSGGFSQIGCSLSQAISLTQPPNSILYVRTFIWSGAAIADGSSKICVAGRNDIPPVNNSYKIGIGIDSPFAKLDVVGSGIFRDKLTVAGDVEARGNLIVQGNIISKYGNSQLPGNSTMSGKLTLDSIAFPNRLGNHISLYGGLGAVPHYGLGVQGGLLQIYSDAAGANIAMGYGNSINFSERARFINNGEVALQTNGRLQVRTGSQSAGMWLSNAANSANVGFVGVPNDNMLGFYSYAGAGWGLTMNANNGYVGIGLNGSAAQAPLQFSNSLGLTKISLYKGPYGDVGIGVYGGELRLQNDIPAGKVSMGVIESNGSYTELAKAERNGQYAFSIFGSLWANGTTYASDGRFKKDIEPLQESLDKVLQMQGVSYNMKTEEFPNEHFTTAHQVGLIAQDIEKIVPEVVSEGPAGYKAIDYAKLVPLLIESIKTQQVQIQALQQKIEKLEKRK